MTSAALAMRDIVRAALLLSLSLLSLVRAAAALGGPMVDGRQSCKSFCTAPNLPRF